jgi:hypothetical protein
VLPPVLQQFSEPIGRRLCFAWRPLVRTLVAVGSAVWGHPGRALFQPTSRELKIHFANAMLAMVYLYRPHSRRKEP